MVGPDPSCHQHQHQHPSVHFPLYSEILGMSCFSVTPGTFFGKKKTCFSQPPKRILQRKAIEPSQQQLQKMWILSWRSLQEWCNELVAAWQQLMSTPDEPKPWLINCGGSPSSNSNWVLKWYPPNKQPRNYSSGVDIIGDS